MLAGIDMLIASHWPYFYLLLFLALGVFFELALIQKEEFDVKYSVIKNLLYILGFCVVTAFCALRVKGVGADDFQYDYFLTANSVELIGLEIGFEYLVHIFRLLDLGFYALSFLVAIIFNVGAFFLSRAFNIPFFFWLFSYACFGNYFELVNDHMRNGLSLGVVMISLALFVRNKYLISFLFLLLAVSIHYSSIIFILAPFALFLNLERKGLLSVLFLCVMLTFIPSYHYVSELLSSLNGISFLDNALLKIASKDLGSQYAVGFSWTLFGGLKFFIATLFLYLFPHFREKREFLICIMLYICGVFLWSFFHEIYIFSGRFWRSMSIVEPIILFYILRKFEFKYVYLAFAMLVLFIFAHMFVPFRSLSYFVG